MLWRISYLLIALRYNSLVYCEPLSELCRIRDNSDRGSQYTSEAFRTALMQAGVQQSLSGVDHCYDNSRMESFFATLKKELLYRIPTYRMKRDTVKSLIFRYVFTYYNQKRVYTANPGGYPPAVYRLLQEDLLAA